MGCCRPAPTRLLLLAAAWLLAGPAAGQGSPCTAWPGEPDPLPTVTDSDPFLARWSELRARELRELADATPEGRPGTVAALRAHAACLSPRTLSGVRASPIRIRRMALATPTPADPGPPLLDEGVGSPSQLLDEGVGSPGQLAVQTDASPGRVAGRGAPEPPLDEWVFLPSAAVESAPPLDDPGAPSVDRETAAVAGRSGSVPSPDVGTEPAPMIDDPEVAPRLAVAETDVPSPPAVAQTDVSSPPAVARETAGSQALAAGELPRATIEVTSPSLLEPEPAVGVEAAPPERVEPFVVVEPVRAEPPVVVERAVAEPPVVTAGVRSEPGVAKPAASDRGRAPEPEARARVAAVLPPAPSTPPAGPRSRIRTVPPPVGDAPGPGSRAPGRLRPEPPAPAAPPAAEPVPDVAAAPPAEPLPDVAAAPPAPAPAATLAPAPEPPLPPPSSALLEAPRRHVRDARFEAALAAIDGVRPKLTGADAAPLRAELEVLAATASLALGRPDDARQRFAAALTADPSLELDPTIYSPKLRDLLTRVRAEKGATP